MRVSCGDLFYGARRRRSEVVFDEELRRTTEEAAEKLHALLTQVAPPPPAYQSRKCDSCSLISACLPKASFDTQAYLRRALGKTTSDRTSPRSNRLPPRQP